MFPYHSVFLNVIFLSCLRFRFSILCLLLAGGSLRSFAQHPFQGERPRRVFTSYENLAWDKASGWIRFDQRLYRNPYRGIAELAAASGDSVFRRFEVLFQGFPVGTYETTDSTLTYRSEHQTRPTYRLKDLIPDPKRYKFDFWIQPVFAARFGYRYKPVESNTSLLLNTQLMLWPGMSLTGGILFPITNDMDNRPKIVRPAPIFLNQFWGRNSHWLSFTAGTFYNDRYGANLQYRKMDLSKPWSFGLEAGLTGVYYYPVGGIYYEPMAEKLLLADVAYRFRKTDVTLKLSGGQFLHTDRGVRFDFVRQFTNVEVGLYAMKTQNGSTAGFNFAVPVPPGKIAQNKSIRIRTGDEFRWEYSYTRGYRIGERYRMGYQLDQKLRQYHEGYLNNQHRGYR